MTIQKRLDARDIEATIDEGDFSGDAAGEIAGEEQRRVANLVLLNITVQS